MKTQFRCIAPALGHKCDKQCSDDCKYYRICNNCEDYGYPFCDCQSRGCIDSKFGHLVSITEISNKTN